MATTPATRRSDVARRIRIDINTVADPGTGYAQLMGVEDLKPVDPELRTTPDEMYEDDGAYSEEVTGFQWRLEFTLKLSLNLAGTSRDPVHQFLRDKFLAAARGSAKEHSFGVRWYDRNGITGEAHEGRVFVKTWTAQGGKDTDTINVVLQGQGAFADITNPAASQTPVVTSVVPATGAQAGGEVISIYGTHFTGATDVDFGADAAEFTVIHDGLVVAAAPAHAAGTVQVKVTTAEGASANTAADDYVYV